MTKIEQAAAVVDAARAAYADAGSLATASRQDIVDLLTLTAELARVVDAQQVRLAGAIAERSTGADDNSICRVLGARNTREAIATAFGIRGRDASELLSMAAATTAAVGLTGQDIAIKHPRVAAALDEGDLSFAQARAIVTTLAPAIPNADLEQLAWAEGCLVEAATDPEAPLPPELLVDRARLFVAVLDPDGILPNDERQRAMRSLRIWREADGGFGFRGYSPPEDGSVLKAVVDAMSSPRKRVRFTDDADGTSGVDAEVDADDRTTEQKQHDALIALAKAHAASGSAPVAGGEVPRLVLTGTIEAFDAYVHGADHPDRSLTVEHTGAIVPIETADRMLCDGVMQRAVVDAAGHVLDLGREVRLFTRAQRRALAVQYRGCATPGCGLPVAWTEAHHVAPWQYGGRTDVGNGILLCSYCHHEVHAGRLVVVGTLGDWRVVAQLRPADRYARNRRTAAGAGCPRTAAAHSAPASLAVKLPDSTLAAVRPPDADLPPSGGARRPGLAGPPVAPGSSGVWGVRRARRTIGLIEARLWQRFPSGRRPKHRVPAIDRPPSPPIVLRT